MTKIIELQACNFKRLKAVHIRPDGHTVVLGGGNAEGKTSVLDAIQAALGGGRAAPVEPIRRGCSRAEVRLELDELIVTRSFSGAGSKIEVRSKEFGKLKSPQAVLDKLTDSLSFDPLAFSRMKPADQAETLRELVGLDTGGVDGEILQLTEERKTANREVKRLQGVADSCTFHREAPELIVLVGDLANDLERASAHNAERDGLLKSAHASDLKRERREQKIQDLEAMLAEYRQEIEDLRGAAEKWRGEAHEVDVKDTDAIRTDLNEAEAINEKVRDNIAYRNAQLELHAAKEAAGSLDKSLDGARSRRRELIEAVTFPIEGLAVSDAGVTFRGFAFDQASGAEQLKVSAAIGIAMNPDLRVLLIRDGSLLDNESLQALGVLAEDADAQLWIERVGDGDEVSVVIEDGEVAEHRPSTISTQ